MLRAATRHLALLLAALLSIGAAMAQPAPVAEPAAPPAQPAEPIASPLAPADTSSPRATLTSLISGINDAYHAAIANDRADAIAALKRAVGTLDASAFPPRFARDRSIEAVIMLKEIFDRIPMPPMDEVPGEGTDVARWRVPGTEIAIVRMDAGPTAGEYLFSAETVARIPEFYERVESLPYKEGGTPGILEGYRATPGSGLSVYWGRKIPAWGRAFVGGAAVWQWIATVVVLALTVAAIAGLLALGRAIERRRSGPSTAVAPHHEEEAGHAPPPPTETRTGFARFRLAMIAALAASAAVTFFAQQILDGVVNLTGAALETITFFLDLAGYILLGWLAVLVVFAIAELYIMFRRLDPRAATGRLARLAAAGISVVVVVALFVHAGNGFGIPAYSIVTGLGVGGIAIGFGAQTLVRDVFSGIFFLVDDAFRPGEYIDVGSAKGFVEQVSVRSVQLRHHNGPLQTIPFGEIKYVNNFSRDWVVMKLSFRVPFETDTERVRKLINKLGREMMEDPELGPQFLEPLKSQGVLEIDDFGLVMRVKFMTKPGEQFTLRRTVYRKLHELFEREGIEFAGREVRVRGGEGEAHAGQISEMMTDELKKAG